jgi:hypothetical protein
MACILPPSELSEDEEVIIGEKRTRAPDTLRSSSQEMLYTHLTPSALRVSLSIHSIPVPNRTVHLVLLLYTCTRVEVVHLALSVHIQRCLTSEMQERSPKGCTEHCVKLSAIQVLLTFCGGDAAWG